MALQMTMTTPQGFEAVDAYHRVENVSLISKSKIQFSIVSYKDDVTDTSFASDSKSADYDLDGDNPIKQAYVYLKTLPEFADATDA